MRCYEEAERVRPRGNDEALLRWNACARLINEHDHIQPHVEDDFVPYLE